MIGEFASSLRLGDARRGQQRNIPCYRMICTLKIGQDSQNYTSIIRYQHHVKCSTV